MLAKIAKKGREVVLPHVGERGKYTSWGTTSLLTRS